MRGVQLFLPGALAVKALSWRRTFQTLLPVTAFICKVLMAPYEKRDSVENLRTLGVLGNCYLSITEQDVVEYLMESLRQEMMEVHLHSHHSPLRKLVQPPS